MIPYYFIVPGKISSPLKQMIQAIVSSSGTPELMIKTTRELPDLRHQKVVFAVQLDEIGQNREMADMLSALYQKGKEALLGTRGIVLLASPNELFTKSYAQTLIFLTNRLGCSFPGHSLVEVTGEYRNLRVWQKTMNISLEDISQGLSRRQGIRLIQDDPVLLRNPRILALHASSRKTSNTVMLWDMICSYLNHCQVEELNVDKGMVLDCRGCDYKECTHFSQQNSCFYGGVVIKDILPAIEKADALVWICPNYNDAISANLMAVINRMTALYRKVSFYRKSLFSVIVSGNSGSDSVARQLIGALNINKGFRLPPYFSIMATANDPGDIRNVPGIEEEVKLFARNMLQEIKR